MDNLKNDKYYLDKIKTDMQFIVDHTKGITQQKLQDDEVLLDSMMFRLIQISESSLKLTESFKNKHEEISWFAIKGLRNRIVHDYGNVDYSIIYDTLKKEIPKTLKIINKIL